MFKRNRQCGSKRLALGLLIGGLAVLVGCSAEDLMGPGSVPLPGEGNGAGGDGSFTILTDPQGKLGASAVSPSAKSSELIAADRGGVVELGRFRLEVPAGALSENTIIEIAQPDPSLLMVELGPHGLQFLKPVVLSVDYSGTDGEVLENVSPTLGVYWFNEATGRWELVGRELEPERNVSKAALEHFSGYSLGFDG